MRTLISAAVVLLVLAGCSTDDEPTGRINDNPPTETNAPDPEPSEVESESDEPVEGVTSDAPPELPTFGQSVTFDDGVTLTIEEPEAFKSSYGSPKGTESVKFTVTVVNESSAPYAVSTDYITVQSGNREAEQIFDSEVGISGVPSTAVLPGRESQFELGFNVADTSDIVMSYQRGDYLADPVYFVS